MGVIHYLKDHNDRSQCGNKVAEMSFNSYYYDGRFVPIFWNVWRSINMTPTNIPDPYGGCFEEVSLGELERAYKMFKKIRCSGKAMDFKKEHQQFILDGINYMKKNNIKKLTYETW